MHRIAHYRTYWPGSHWPGSRAPNVILDEFLKYEEKWKGEETPKTKTRLVFYSDLHSSPK